MHQNGPLVGRDDELGLIEQALSRLQSGRPGVVEVTGEPGMGKTRLLDELTRTAMRYGCAVARGGAGERERDMPYGAVTDVLDPLLAELGSETLRLRGQAQLAAVSPSLPGPRVDPRPLLEVQRHRLFAAVQAQQRLGIPVDQMHAQGGRTVALVHKARAHNQSQERLSWTLKHGPVLPDLSAIAAGKGAGSHDVEGWGRTPRLLMSHQQGWRR